MSIRIVLADDHLMFREALRGPLAAEPDLEIVAEADTGAQALAALERVRADVLVLDIGLPDMNGIEVARRVRKQYPQIGITALSGYADKLFVEQMLKAGAQAYVVKSAGTRELIAAIRAVANGQCFLCAEVTGLMVNRLNAEASGTAPPLSVLGKREQEILCMVAQGMRSAAIAAELGITVGTVDVHRRNIKQKLGLHSTAELIRYAIREGLNPA